MKIKNQMLTLTALTITLIVFNACNDTEKFRSQGVETTATINDIVWKKSGKYSGNDKTKKYNHFRVSYFTQVETPPGIEDKKIVERDENGELKMNFDKLIPKIGEYVSTEIYVSSSQMKKYKKGDKVQILYLPDDIENAILKEDLE
jgi:hypothetical protein